ncbi:hypothetical protein DL240_07085 [Lujinxingia litoralis]|uniref:Type II secretion system protein GspE N-terminal domain-containing protein n=1 Tax=Lujinxingia litoralis TaxID=2211119 RepID=A0A328CA84_9DELT|nr:hypothetical protein [Lujinxingia litoralis]RAL23904.1 hypothetical protein DL240_07085 [Lujinxingia litoralis]
MIDDAQLIPQLLAAGLVDQARLQRGLRLAQQEAASLYDVLIFHGLVEESSVVEIASSLLNVPCVHLENTAISLEMAHQVPLAIARHSRTLPLRFIEDGDNRVLLLAMADPIDVMAMDEIASHTGVNIRPVLVGPADLRRAIEELYARADAQEDPLPKPTTVEHHSGLFAAFDQPESSPVIDDAILELDAPIVPPPNAGADDSWAAFFDNAQDLGAEESSVISQEMRDRPPTDVFEVVDDDLEELDIEAGFDFGVEPLPSLLEESVGTSLGHALPLEEWELDEDFDSPAPRTPDSDLSRPPTGFTQDEANRTQMGLGLRGLGLNFNAPADDDEEMPLRTLDVELLSIEEELDAPEDEAIPPLPDSEVEENDRDDQAAGDECDAQAVESPDQRPSLSLQEKLSQKQPISQSIRDALQKHAPDKKDNAPTNASSSPQKPDERDASNTLGRIQVKRIAVPRFGGAIEKRSDLSTTPVEDQDSDGLSIPDDIDAAILARAALKLLVEHNLVSAEDVQALINRLRS